MTVDQFDAFFRQVHGVAPFPWQLRLAAQVLRGDWPKSIALPTAAGKTALIDIAVFALAAGAEGCGRRIFFVVDRRVIVDEAAERAKHLNRALAAAAPDTPAGAVAGALRKLAGPDAGPEPLHIAKLRGGLARDDGWAKSPLRPAVCCSTVDQVGSSLLFRAYGTGASSWPIRAGLVGNDALLIVDEAHTANPFLETLETVQHLRSWREATLELPGLRVIEMSATPRTASGVFKESDEDRAEGCVLRDRWGAAKPARLAVADAPAEGGAAEGDFSGLIAAMVAEARRLRQQGAAVVGVVANRVATAREIHNRLKGDAGTEAELLIGRCRPYDRDQLWKRLEPKIKLGRKQSEPVYVVSTQCIEVGANLDFDALVTEVAAIDALEQRFGRLNRDGRAIRARASIVAQKDQTSARYVDAVYGEALGKTWRWLKKSAHSESESVVEPAALGKKPKTVKRKYEAIDMGVDALRVLLARAENRNVLVTERKQAPALLPAHVDRWSETAPQPAVEPEPALFLHGPASGSADIAVVWRADLNENEPGAWADVVTLVPPRAEEMLTLPVWTVRRWLARTGASLVADIEGVAEERSRGDKALRPFLNWRGDDTELGDRLIPGSTIVVPATYGGCDEWGWNPDWLQPVSDLGDVVSLIRGTPSLRVDCWAASTGLRAAQTNVEVREALSRIAETAASPDLAKIAQAFLGSRRLRRFYGKENDDGVAELAAVTALPAFDQDRDSSSYTEDVELAVHLQKCAERAAAYARELGLPARMAQTVELAAAWHDIGKADQRFQSWLRGGNPVPAHSLPLAKSNQNGGDRKARERARVRALYPQGARHELQSVALLEASPDGDGVDWDLLLHLVGSHHGHCRPFAPVVPDAEPVMVRYSDWSAASNHGLESVGSGVSARFWRLTRRYGWWGLAWMEALVRLADHRQSEWEQKGGSE